MEEQLIEFKTAVLAKEKKFNIPCENFYIEYIDDDVADLFNYEEQRGSGYAELYRNNQEFKYSASTQFLLQKWIRDIHKIHMEIILFEDDTWGGDLIYKNAPYEWNDKEAPLDVEYCKTYEDTLELLLQKALELI